MLYIWNIERIIEETVEELHLDINYKYNYELTVPMSFNISTKTIHFNYIRINGYIGKLFKLRETEENIVKLIVYRMLGYYLDFKKNRHDLRDFIYGNDREKEVIQSKIERNAWIYGRTLVPEHLLDAYDKIHAFEKMYVKSDIKIKGIR